MILQKYNYIHYITKKSCFQGMSEKRVFFYINGAYLSYFVDCSSLQNKEFIPFIEKIFNEFFARVIAT